ncbi:MAG: sortase [Candidatus Nomurabacteria bacterium]|jgi:sortase A|nr:sortase [Candidatus Nomurabacteria bacterium]
MNPEDGGLTNQDRQRQTAAEIARKKVLEAYKLKPENYATPEKKPEVKEEDWRKYHSAWQDYYQRYYGQYYGKAAHDYVEKAKLKYEREQAEKRRSLDDIIEQPKTTDSLNTERADAQNSIRAKIRDKAAKRASKFRRSRHFIPIIMGLAIILIGVLFQYNQVIVANAVAYITPGGGNVNEITAIDPNVSSNIGPESKLLIPKLNVDVPITFGSANDQKSMNQAMNNGVAQFAISGASAVPGEKGNFVISGHSAGNIYQNSNYKFIFSGLTRLGAGDLIYVNYKSTRYAYSVLGAKTVEPTDVQSVINIAKQYPDKPLITLITCTPLGTSRYRLLVYAEQISPSYDGAATAEPGDDSANTDLEMPANQPSPLEQFWLWLTGQS